MKVRLLGLAALVLAMACEDTRQPTGPTAPADPSKIISDGAHGGNKDFFFLPPLVPLPLNNPDFELGKFNNALRPSLKIEICELKAENLNSQGLPTANTECIAGAPIKTFAPGSVQLVNLPLRQNGWWTLFNLPPDGFYYVLWDTRQSNLNVNKYYRIKVLIDGSSDPLGIADVDPMSSLRQWKYSLTGQVIQLIDDVLLPIPFRVERGALCSQGSICTSTTITNDNPNGDVQVVQAPGNNGPIAGAVFPDGWLPPGGPQSVVVTINSVNTGVNDVATGTQQFPCHPDLPLQQFNGCFNFSTIPALEPIAEGGHQFARNVTVVACYVLHDTEDPREKYAQLWSSGPNEPAHPLVSVTDALVLTAPTEHACGTNFSTVIGSNVQSNKLTELASAGWRRLKGGFGRVFGVKTAYAVDLGLGGLTLDFSNVGPAINAHMTSGESPRNLSVEVGETVTLVGRIVGTQLHDGSALSTGIPGLPITFTVGQANGGGLRLIGSEAPLANQVTDLSNSGLISPGSAGSGGGFVSVHWTAPMTAGTYTVNVTSPSVIGLVTYEIVVRPSFGVLNGNWLNEELATPDVTRVNIGVDGSAVTVEAWGKCSPTDCPFGATTANTSAWNTAQQVVAVWDHGYAIHTMTIAYLSATRLQVTLLHDFLDPDRADFTTTEFFTKEAPIP